MKNLFIVLILVLSTTVFIACTSNVDLEQANDEIVDKEDVESSTSMTLEEMSMHNSEDDCYVAIDENVYDLTSYIPKHPAGPESIIESCGTDASEPFKNEHERDMSDQLPEFYVAPLSR